MLNIKDIIYNEGGKLEAFLLGFIINNNEIKDKELNINYIKEYIEGVEDSGEFELAYESLEDIGPDFELYVQIREENRLDSLAD